MEGVADPGVAEAVGRQADVVLAPDLLVFERVETADAARQVPGQGVDAAALLDVLDDDRQVGARPNPARQTGVDRHQPIEEDVVVVEVAQVGRVVGVNDIEIGGAAATALGLGAAGVEHVPVGRGGQDVVEDG